MTWPELIACTKKKLSRTEIKVAQLKALLKTFRHAYASGAPTPFEVAAHGARCHCGHLNVQHTGEAGLTIWGTPIRPVWLSVGPCVWR
jgi:hypothetical protein